MLTLYYKSSNIIIVIFLKLETHGVDLNGKVNLARIQAFVQKILRKKYHYKIKMMEFSISHKID
jgi:hypothetical protein